MCRHVDIDNPDMIKLAIFDMDGTIFESYLDWSKIKEELEIRSGNILKELYRDNTVDKARLTILENYEEENTLKTKPIPGIFEWLSFLSELGIKTALITNNNRKNTRFLLKKYNLKFDTVITRESGLWKPDPDPFLHVMLQYCCEASEIISIGDSLFDIKASKASGIPYIFIIKKKSGGFLREVDTENVVFFNDFIHLKEIFKQRNCVRQCRHVDMQ